MMQFALLRIYRIDRAHPLPPRSEIKDLLMPRRPSQGAGYGFQIERPGTQNPLVAAFHGYGEDAVLPDFRGIPSHVRHALAIRRERDIAVDIARYRLRSASQYGNAVKVPVAPVCVLGFAEIDVVAIRREREASIMTSAGRNELGITAAGHIAQP